MAYAVETTTNFMVGLGKSARLVIPDKAIQPASLLHASPRSGLRLSLVVGLCRERWRILAGESPAEAAGGSAS